MNRLIPADVPIFPKFRKIKLSDKLWYENFYKQIQPISDLCFNNLIVWLDLGDNLEIAQFDNCIILEYGDPFASQRTSISVVTSKINIRLIKLIFDYQIKKNILPFISMLSSEALCSLDKDAINNLNIIHDIDNSDYVVNIENNYKLDDSNNKHFRREIYSFLKTYGNDIIVKDYMLNNSAEKETIKNALAKWGSNFSVGFGEKNKLGVEGFALDRLFNNAEYLGSRCLGIKLNNDLIGFVIYYLAPQNNFAIGNHLKCDYSYRYISDFIYYCALSRLHSMGIKYFNVEQDLGIEGIRIHKHSMHPEFMINRFCLEPITAKNKVLTDDKSFVHMPVDYASPGTAK